MRTVYALAHHQPCLEAQIVNRLLHGPFQNAHWHGTEYTDAIIPKEVQLAGYKPILCANLHSLRLRAAAARRWLCVCSWVGAPNTGITYSHRILTCLLIFLPMCFGCIA